MLSAIDVAMVIVPVHSILKLEAWKTSFGKSDTSRQSKLGIDFTRRAIDAEFSDQQGYLAKLHPQCRQLLVVRRYVLKISLPSLNVKLDPEAPGFILLPLRPLLPAGYIYSSSISPLRFNA